MTPATGPSRAWRWTVGLAAAYLALHLPWLAPSLEDIDSINFALGLHDFDVARHQPHPPGAPVYIAAGRVVLWVVSAFGPTDAAHADALALSLLSALAGALALAGAGRLFAAVEERFGDGRANPVWPVALLAAAPLFFMTGLRPMSDMPGLAAVLWSQALALEARSRHGALAVSALVAGVGAGIRIQSVALTAPVLVFAVLGGGGSALWRRLGLACAAGLAGVTLWAVPLVAGSGGPTGYLRALGSQAIDDFAGVDMLWSEPTARALAIALSGTFVQPWASASLAGSIAVAAAIGVVVAFVRTPRAAGVMLLAFGPYLIYHLLLQEALTVRYALPGVPLVAWFATRGTGLVRRAPALAVGLSAWALVVAVPGGMAFGREAHPAYRAMDDARRRAMADPPGGVFAHLGLRRSLEHGGAGLPFVEPVRQYEWMGPFDYWRGGGVAPVWFFGDPLRTDLALIDPASRRDVTRYAWAVAERAEFGGARPLGVDWYRMPPPGWFLGEGWSLTPEAGGVSRATAQGLEHETIEGWVKRRPGPMQIVIGGTHLGQAGTPDAELRLLIDDVVIETWVLQRDAGTFLRFITVPPMRDERLPYAPLRIESRALGPGRRPNVAIRQFDAQPLASVVYGFGEGWHDAESDPAAGLEWRWTSERSVIEVRGTAQPLRLVLHGDSPLAYFDGPPVVRVTSAGRVLAELQPAADFEAAIDVPPDVWSDGAARVVIEMDRVYLPGEVEGTGDLRRLGLRLFTARIDTVLP